MCGRYVVTGLEHFKARFNISDTLYDTVENQNNYNVAPGQTMPVITHDEKGNHLKNMKWGLVPHWAKDPAIGFKTINARIETIRHKPAFEKPFKTQRILVPASGFYEWKHLGKEKIPYFIHPKDSDIWSFAGLYDIWEEEPFGNKLYSFTIITKQPPKDLMEIHNRMPAIVPKDLEEDWLDETNKDSDKLIKILDQEYTEYDYYQVSNLVNKPINQGPELLKKAS
ncbi:MAG: SOS response-associated peptidase [Bacteroidetes bacterium]|nr:SOS response-associated peptidase [Bacteroidota bacterium]